MAKPRISRPRRYRKSFFDTYAYPLALLSLGLVVAMRKKKKNPPNMKGVASSEELDQFFAKHEDAPRIVGVVFRGDAKLALSVLRRVARDNPADVFFYTDSEALRKDLCGGDFPLAISVGTSPETTCYSETPSEDELEYTLRNI